MTVNILRRFWFDGLLSVRNFVPKYSSSNEINRGIVSRLAWRRSVFCARFETFSTTPFTLYERKMNNQSYNTSRAVAKSKYDNATSESQGDCDDSEPVVIEIPGSARERHWLVDFVSSTKILSNQQWKSIKDEVESQGLFKRTGSFETLAMCACCAKRNYSLGRSLINFSGDSANLVTLSKFLRLIGECDEETTEEIVLEVYEKLTKKHKVFDYGSSEDIIIGLCRTSRWNESLSYLETMKLTNKSPSRIALVAIAVAAFRDQKYELGFDMLKTAGAFYSIGMSLDVPLKKLMEECKKAPCEQQSILLEMILNFLREHEIFVSKEIAEEIKNLFESRKHAHWIGCYTTVSLRGRCESCNTNLENLELTDDEFTELRNSFMDRVLKGDDIFLRSTPAELKSFVQFVKYTAPYDVVLDGLNVAYHQSRHHSTPYRLAEQLLNVVNHFKQLDQKVLVVGRQHMHSWPKKLMEIIKRDAIVFFAQNISKDDPFLIYAALYSGKGTMFLSRDMMRDHVYSLNDRNLANSFRKWQRKHQIELIGIRRDGSVLLKPTLLHNPVVQNTANSWHIPFSEISRMQTTVPNTWLCINLQSKSTKNSLNVANIMPTK